MINDQTNDTDNNQQKPYYSCRKKRLSTNYHNENISFLDGLLKRSFDIVFSFLVLVTIFPFMLTILFLVYTFSSEHRYPIFFKQKRTGLHGKTFMCYKFRSMKINPHAHSNQATDNDPRITQFGQFLRRTSLDEIPQFFNVLLGNMSVVGPRPHMLKHTVKYATLIENYMDRHSVKPGITGYAQITGYRGETRELHKMEGRIKRDLWYINNHSFWLDLKIIVCTPIKIKA